MFVSIPQRRDAVAIVTRSVWVSRQEGMHRKLETGQAEAEETSARDGQVRMGAGVHVLDMMIWAEEKLEVASTLAGLS